MRFKAKGGRLTRDDLDGLFNEYYPRIFNYLYYRTLDRALSDDLVGTVMLNVVRKYETFDLERGNLDAWIFRIARNTLFSHFRKSKIEVDLDAVPQMTLSYEDEDALDDKGEMVRGLLEVLTDDERELVYLKYWEELSNKEIAERLGLNPSTVSTNLWRANNKMRKAMPND
ncbi:MAG: sigma-70 family RNA polymerase sigma factor [Atopobiaceae bacterium]|nr:sigma-70 family RNA polymerase sigma factor [Atopobiaceae bacterium]